MDGDSEAVQNLEVDIPYYPELTETEITNIDDCVQQDFPMETNFPTEAPKKDRGNDFGQELFPRFSFQETYIVPSETEIKKYQCEKYPQWLQDVRAYFKDLAENLFIQNRTNFVIFCVNNFGSAAAENALIEFHALGDILLIWEPDSEEMEEISEKMKFPTPPVAPKGHWEAPLFNSLENYIRKQHKLDFKPSRTTPIVPNFEKRDKNAIYWKPRRPGQGTNYWCFECEELRHQIENECFFVGIDTSNNEKEIYEGAVKCVVSAKNLAKPVEHIVKIKAKLVRMDTKKEIMAYYRKEKK
jgi:hypothetical protein